MRHSFTTQLQTELSSKGLLSCLGQLEDDHALAWRVFEAMLICRAYNGVRRSAGSIKLLMALEQCWYSWAIYLDDLCPRS